MAKVHATFTLDWNPEAPKWATSHHHHHWRVQLRFQRRQMTLWFYTGQLITNPTTADVMECLLSDTHAADLSFWDFRDEYYPTGGREVEKIYEEIKTQTARLKRLLGEWEYHEAIGNPETWCQEMCA